MLVFFILATFIFQTLKGPNTIYTVCGCINHSISKCHCSFLTCLAKAFLQTADILLHCTIKVSAAINTFLLIVFSLMFMLWIVYLCIMWVVLFGRQWWPTQCVWGCFIILWVIGYYRCRQDNDCFFFTTEQIQKKGAALLIFKCYIKCFKAGFPITSEFTNQFYAHVLSTSVMIILHFN